MKVILAILLGLFKTLSVFAQTTVCTPTVGEGNIINYATVGDGLNRISKIEITTGKAGPGGYGILLKLMGTKGVGGANNQAKDVVHELPWAMAYGSDLIEYNNSSKAKSTLAAPYIRFEIENSGGQNFLGVLTFSSAKEPKSARIFNSRYNCVPTP
jgi:hypothetical protein